MIWLTYGLAMVVLAILLFISLQDISTRIISHKSLLALAITLIPLMYMLQQPVNYLAPVLILIIGFLLFVLNVIGGGDVKLIALLSITLSFQNLADFLMLTAIVGGVAAFVGLVFFRQKTRQHGVPYATAITLSFILISPFFKTFF
jgi:prepilin peptidase CpaA